MLLQLIVLQSALTLYERFSHTTNSHLNTCYVARIILISYVQPQRLDERSCDYRPSHRTPQVCQESPGLAPAGPNKLQARDKVEAGANCGSCGKEGSSSSFNGR